MLPGLQPQVDACRAAHARLAATLSGLTDAVARQPSLLPDWSIGHVLAHVARNADSVVRRLEGALRGAVVDQYPGGAEGRAAEIAAGADRPAAELVADVLATNAEVEALLDRMPDDAWDRLGRTVAGHEQPVRFLPMARAREVEIHHSDLGLGYTWADWPDDLVDAWLPSLLEALPDRAGRRHLAAWALRRADPPPLPPW